MGEFFVFFLFFTCVSGSSDPMLAAPSLTTSVSCVMVLAEDWAAWDSLSCPEAAPDTSILVSSTRALAVFRMFSLRHVNRPEKEEEEVFRACGWFKMLIFFHALTAEASEQKNK